MRHYINGIEVTPRNRTEIGVISDFSGNPEVLSLSVDSIILPREAKAIIDQHIASFGLFQAIPYKVTLEGGISLDYMIDLTDNIKVRQHEFEVKLKRRKYIDDFRTQADGLSFEYLASQWPALNYQIRQIPYFIVKDNQLEQSLQLGIATFIMTRELISAIRDTSVAIANLVESATPITGLSPAGPVISYNFGAIIRASLIAVAQIVYTAALLVAVIKLGTQILTTLFPPIRNFLGIKFNSLMKEACQYLGYSYASSTISDKWVICPVPLTRDADSVFDQVVSAVSPAYNKGYPTASDTTPTLGTFIEALETMFNARLIVTNGAVRIERRDWLNNLSTANAIPSLSLQGERDDEYSYQTTNGEIWKRYYIHYQVDFTDLHTCEQEMYDAHDAEYSTELAQPIADPNMSLVRGLNDVSVPFALARRKDKLTIVEALAKGLLSVVDALTGVFGGGTSFVARINSRKDAIRISQQYFAVTKVMYAVEGEFRTGGYVQRSDYLNYCSASSLWDGYHNINAIQSNDWIVFENVRVRLTAQDFVTLQSNNFVLMDGQLVEILKIEWIDEKAWAQVSYRKRGYWANGKTNVIKIN
jgi:hypothetical protein